MDRTLILVKPDAFARRLTGEVIARFERKGLQLAALKMMVVSEELAREHYGEHVGRDFYEPLVTFITSGPIVAMILEGPGAIEAARQIIGTTDGIKAAPGSIRGDYALEVRRNLVHGSDSAESAVREIKIFFGEA
jgi:nucleoside-diphosphate kinase